MSTRFFSVPFNGTALVATIIEEAFMSKAETSGWRIIPQEAEQK
jgi:hypothetical protein